MTTDWITTEPLGSLFSIAHRYLDVLIARDKIAVVEIAPLHAQDVLLKFSFEMSNGRIMAFTIRSLLDGR